MSVSLAKIEEIAPDQGSLNAARGLVKGKPWPVVAEDGAGLIWGECQGSGAQPYRVAVSETDLGYKCTCPSRKFPCKHSLALMWMRAEGRPFAAQERPDWVNDWLSRRRGPGAPRPREAEAERSAPSIAAAEDDEAEAPQRDEKAEARAAAQRDRNRAEREASVLAGLDELDLWLADQLASGLAGFPAVAQERCGLLARRLVDAKAGGLAARVEQLAATLFGLPDAARGDFLIEAFGELHLIAEAYRRQDELPEALRADVRLTIGWPLAKEALLADPGALRLRGGWMVVATVNTVQPDRLRRLETWLSRLDLGDGPRFAVLTDFVPVSAGAVGSLYAPGERLEAELAFYPSGAPLRAIIAEQTGGALKEGRWPAPAEDLAGAMAHYDGMLARRPWLGDWPLGIRDARVARLGGELVLSDRAGTGLPIAARDDDAVLPLLGMDGLDVFGLWDGRRLDLRFAETPVGRWTAA